MPHIECNHIKLHAQAVGEGPLLTCCHGLVNGNIASWYFSMPKALQSEFQVLMYDQRGHGKSELTDSGYDLDTMAADLAGLIDHYGAEIDPGRAEKLHLMGHSYGGLIALAYALQYPQRIASLILVDAPLPAARYVYPSMSQLTNAEAVAAFAQEIIDRLQIASERQQNHVKQRLQYLFLESSLPRDVKAAGDIADADLAGLSVPTLCLYGEDSPCIEAGRRLARVLPQAQLELLPCGHFIPLEAPALMWQAARRFLSEHRATDSTGES